MSRLMRPFKGVEFDSQGRVTRGTISLIICQEKDFYETKGNAERAAKGRITENSQVVIRAYKCNECVGWHLTSQPRREKYDDSLVFTQWEF